MPDETETTTTKASKGAAAVPPKDDLLAAAQVKSPHVTREFLAKHGLDDDYLQRLADGTEPPAPYNGPDESATDLHRTDGGWQITPPGVEPSDTPTGQVSR